MKLLEVRQIASERLNVLRQQREKLINMTKENVSVPQNNINFDRIEISKAISDIDKEYEQISDIADKLSIMDANIQNAEISRQQSEAAAEAAEEIMKILEVFRRISKGDKVPPTDEKKLMEYNQQMYMAAKNMAFMNKNCDGEKHKSLWEDKPAEEEPVEPSEIANNTEVGNPLAEIPTSTSEICTDLE